MVLEKDNVLVLKEKHSVLVLQKHKCLNFIKAAYVSSQKHNTECADSMAQKDHSALEKSQGHGNAQIVVFRVRGTFWQEYFVDRRYMRQVIFQGLYFEQIKGHGFRIMFKNTSKRIKTHMKHTKTHVNPVYSY